MVKSMPIGGPLYPPAPYKYPNAQGLAVLGNINKAKISKILPKPLKSSIGISIFLIFHYPDSTIGPYNEMIIFVPVKFKKDYGVKMNGIFCPYIYVTTDIAFASGREIWGFPKKMASFSLKKTKNKIIYIVEREKKQILRIFGDLKTEMDTERIKKASSVVNELGILTLKQFMNANCKEYALQRIIHTKISIDPIKLRNVNNIEISAEVAEADPIYKILPDKLIGGIYGIFNCFLPRGEIILDFTKEIIKTVPSK